MIWFRPSFTRRLGKTTRKLSKRHRFQTLMTERIKVKTDPANTDPRPKRSKLRRRALHRDRTGSAPPIHIQTPNAEQSGDHPGVSSAQAAPAQQPVEANQRNHSTKHEASCFSSGLNTNGPCQRGKSNSAFLKHKLIS